MKIPETSANVGAYYGNEENGQWQPNGVIIDSGVGGGVVGSGDAGIHRPPVYPLHIPRGHIPGYVMAGAFYPPAFPVAPPPAAHDDFEDYMWMENEEEFDKQVMQQLEEEALMEQCIEAMLEDEQREQRSRARNGHAPHAHYPTTSNGNPLSLEETVSRSTLNPLAAEFVPTGGRVATRPEPQPDATISSKKRTKTKKFHQPWWDFECSEMVALRKEAEKQFGSAMTEENYLNYKKVAARTRRVLAKKKKRVEKTELSEQPPTQPASEPVPTEDVSPQTPAPSHTEQTQPEDSAKVTELKTEETAILPETPEVSAAELSPSTDKRPKEAKKDVKVKETKKPLAKVDSKPKPKPVAVKSEPKVAPKKKDAPKAVKSETPLEDVRDAPVIEAPKIAPASEESIPVPSGPKPINYAAAARANKPKKPSPPSVAPPTPITDKIAPPKTDKKLTEKPKEKAKVEKVVQRKNSAK